MGNRKFNIPMCAAFILFILTLISMHLTSGLFARYTATATGTDSARVAKFDVRGSLDRSDITVNCKETGKSGVYTITVNNQSEVTVGYIIYIKMDQAVNGTDLWVKMSDDSNINPNRIGASQEMKFTRGPLAPGASGEHKFELGIDDWGTVTGKVPTQGQETYDWDLGFTVEIVATQVD